MATATVIMFDNSEVEREVADCKTCRLSLHVCECEPCECGDGTVVSGDDCCKDCGDFEIAEFIKLGERMGVLS